MLVLSREPGKSIHIESHVSTWCLTVLKLLHENRSVEVLVNHASREWPGHLDSKTVLIAFDSGYALAEQARISLVDLREDKARLGIEAPKDWCVHRLEVPDANFVLPRLSSDGECR